MHIMWKVENGMANLAQAQMISALHKLTLKQAVATLNCHCYFVSTITVAHVHSFLEIPKYMHVQCALLA